MKTKRFILMLLVMLGSVTGAWAEDTGTSVWSSTLVNEYSDSDGPVTCTIDNINYSFPKSYFTQIATSYTQLCKLNGAVLTTNNQCKITGVFLMGLKNPKNIDPNIHCYHQNGSSITIASQYSDTDGDYTELTFRDPVDYVRFTCYAEYSVTQLVVSYVYPEHKHIYENIEHDGTKHWWTCNSNIGLCKENKKTEQHVYSSDRNDGAAYYTCSVCGYVNLQRRHQHIPSSEWSADNAQHWHTCLNNTDACCDNPKLDSGNHIYGESGAAKYTCQLCHYIDPYRQHQHEASAQWSYDQNQHWHACVGTEGLCNMPKSDVANHCYGDAQGTYYTCQICGGENDSRKKESTADYFSLTATGGDMTIGMKKFNSPESYRMQYSADKIHWTSMTLTETSIIVTIPAGQTYFFRSPVENVQALSVPNGYSYWTFTMTGNGTVQAAGNLYSLLGMTYATSLSPIFNQDYFFNSLFLNCGKLTAVNIYDFHVSNNLYHYFDHWLDGTAASTTGIITLPDNMVDAAFLELPSNWICKQKVDYIDQVKDAASDIDSPNIASLVNGFSNNIKNAVGNNAAKSQRDFALKALSLYSDGYNHGSEDSYSAPTEPGLRLKVTTKDGKVFERNTRDIESVEYHEVTE